MTSKTEPSRIGHVMSWSSLGRFDLLTLCTIVMLWVTITLLLLGQFNPGDREIWNIGIAAVIVFIGTFIFLDHGKERITALGLFSYAFGLIIGFGGIQVVLDPYFVNASDPQKYLAIALSACAIGFTLVSFIVYLVEPKTVVAGGRLDEAQSNLLIGFGAISLLFLLVIGDSVALLIPFREGMALALVLIFALGVILHPGSLHTLWRVCLTLLGVYMFVEYFHDGTGRLRIVALGCAILLVISFAYQRMLLKWIAVVATPVALLWLSTSRLELEKQFSGIERDLGDGLSSMLASTGIFADLIYSQERGYPLGMGGSFLTAFFVPLPEHLQPDWLPDALGYELVSISAPERVGTGYSTVASVFGEWWWNFGPLGVLLAVPCLGFVLVWLDRLSIGSFAKAITFRGASPVYFIFWIMLVGSLGDLVWSGSHTWLTRMYARLIPLVVLFLLLSLHRRSTPSSREAVHR